MKFPKKSYSNNALVVMLKAPVAGKVKTRLVPPLTSKDAAKLYRCFIQDTFNLIGILNNIDIIAAYTPLNFTSKIKKIVSSKTITIPQKGKDIGERLENIFSLLFFAGYKKITIMGADSPDLPIKYIEKSFALLKGKKELVLGPAKDGGYYLIAMSRECKEIFKGIPWSTYAVFSKTLEKAKNIGFQSVILPEWYDIDNINDLHLIRNNLRMNPAALNTAKAIEKIFKNISANR